MSTHNPEAAHRYLVDHGAATEEIGTLATLLADILSEGPLRDVALRIAAEQPSVIRARALLGCGWCESASRERGCLCEPCCELRGQSPYVWVAR